MEGFRNATAAVFKITVIKQKNNNKKSSVNKEKKNTAFIHVYIFIRTENEKEYRIGMEEETRKRTR